MPIYEFQCETCSTIRELRMPLSDTNELKTFCVKCKEVKEFNRMISKSSFQLKGDGWYVTDYTGG